MSIVQIAFFANRDESVFRLQSFEKKLDQKSQTFDNKLHGTFKAELAHVI